MILVFTAILLQDGLNFDPFNQAGPICGNSDWNKVHFFSFPKSVGCQFSLICISKVMPFNSFEECKILYGCRIIHCCKVTEWC